MVSSKEYEIVFPGIKSGSFRGRDIILPFSLPLLPYTASWLGDNEAEQERKLKAFLLYFVNAKPKSLHIVLADVLQRFTIMVADGCTEDKAKQEIARRSKDFYTPLKKWIDIYLRDSGIDFEIIEWQDLISTKKYTNCLRAVDKAYVDDMVFKDALNSTALKFIKNSRLSDNSPENVSSAMMCNVDYLKEEIAVLLDWQYDYLVYPSRPTPAISRAYEVFSGSYEHIPRYAIFRIDMVKNDTSAERLDSYQSAFSLLPGNIYYKDRGGNYLWCNNQFAKILGLDSAAQIAEKNDSDFLEESLANVVTRNDMTIMNSGEPFSSEECGVNDKKEKTPYFTTKTPVLNKDGEVIGLLGISIDITDRKKAESLQKEKEVVEKISQAIEVMAGCIAHEVRTPLSVIGINIDVLKKYLDDVDVFARNDEYGEKVKKCADNIRQAVDGGSHTVDMLLYKLHCFVNRKESCGVDVSSFEVISINDLIEIVMELYPFYGETGVTDWDKNLNGDFKFRGDPIITKQIFFNLIKNALWAIKEAEKGKISVRLKRDKKYNYVLFRDTALGISDKQMKNIFEPFVSNKRDGFGLGLNFCKTMMSVQGGDITCDSKEGEYTEFTLSFPVL